MTTKIRNPGTKVSSRGRDVPGEEVRSHQKQPKHQQTDRFPGFVNLRLRRRSPSSFSPSLRGVRIFPNIISFASSLLAAGIACPAERTYR
ncbi:hypothetical protein N657DRAFT_343889 [Parathielavia appendiculata]|uniref:Uncharacterized protein n=1 Tax=Parathielavia appendiculata TaxID=2587402 RepID=A0AAN6U234_9PEZI|nr:hypothetical protein N657DRAFT_343889 [Parathielavia appendiculata]